MSFALLRIQLIIPPVIPGRALATLIPNQPNRDAKFTELNDAMREYHEIFGHELPPLPREPVLSDFYTPTDEQHHRELGFIALSMIGIGAVLYCIRITI